MPQTTAEKKFFLTRAGNFFLSIASQISKTHNTASFQRYKGFLKNITGGEA